MKRAFIAIGLMGGVVITPGWVHARDLGQLVLPIHEGKLTSSLLYEHLKLKDDFDTRGRGDFTSNVVGTQFSYGINDQIAVAVKGGVLVEPQEEVQNSQWKSRAGYLYGLDLYNEVFPATSMRPGVQLSGGVSGFLVPFDRLNSGDTVTLIDQKMTGYEYHGAVLATLKFSQIEPYAGLRGFGSTNTWRDNAPAAGSPATITGHEHGNISIVVGLPVQITKDIRFQAEGRFVSETAVTTGFTIAAF